MLTCRESVRPALVPIGRLLVRVSELQHGRFSAMLADNMNADRKTAFGEATRNGNRRRAVNIKWRVVSIRQRSDLDILIDISTQVRDCRLKNRVRRSNQQIHTFKNLFYISSSFGQIM